MSSGTSKLDRFGSHFSVVIASMREVPPERVETTTGDQTERRVDSNDRFGTTDGATTSKGRNMGVSAPDLSHDLSAPTSSPPVGSGPSAEGDARLRRTKKAQTQTVEIREIKKYHPKDIDLGPPTLTFHCASESYLRAARVLGEECSREVASPVNLRLLFANLAPLNPVTPEAEQDRLADNPVAKQDAPAAYDELCENDESRAAIAQAGADLAKQGDEATDGDKRVPAQAASPASSSVSRRDMIRALQAQIAELQRLESLESESSPIRAVKREPDSDQGGGSAKRPRADGKAGAGK